MSMRKNLQEEFALYCNNTGLPRTRTAEQMLAASDAGTMPALSIARDSYLRDYAMRWNKAEQLQDQPSCFMCHYLAAQNWEQSDQLTSELTPSGAERMIDILEPAFGDAWLAYRDNNGLTLDQVSQTIIERFECK